MALRLSNPCSVSTAVPVDTLATTTLSDPAWTRPPRLLNGVLPGPAERTPSLLPPVCPGSSLGTSRVKRAGARVGSAVEFEDVGHVNFYSTVRCGKKYRGEFKRMKSLLKDTKKKLHMIASASVHHAEAGSLCTSESEATSKSSEDFMNQVLQQLNEIDSQLKYLSERSKMGPQHDASSSSSSSSSSSDSDMDVRKKAMGGKAKLNMRSAAVIAAVTSTQSLPLVTDPSSQTSQAMPRLQGQAASELTKVEVCLGGKCRRSGASQLLAALEDKASSGAPILPSACNKCMGKCKTAPNLKVGEMDGASSTLHSFVSVNELDLILEQHGACHVHRKPLVHQ